MREQTPLPLAKRPQEGGTPPQNIEAPFYRRKSAVSGGIGFAIGLAVLTFLIGGITVAAIQFYITTLLSFLVLSVIAIQAEIYQRQWKAMQDGLEETRKVVAAMDKQSGHMEGQFEVMKQQADIAFRQLETTDRPWLVVDAELTSDLTFDERGIGHLGCRVIARNIGRSVAVNTTINAKTVIPIQGSNIFGEEVLREQAGICGDIHAPFIMGSYTLFPMDGWSSDYGFSLSPQDLGRGRLKIPTLNPTL
jgi:hypothetical protein